MSDTGQEQGGWREAVASVVNKAAENPEAFEQDVKLLAKRFGLSVEQVYAKIQEVIREDPDLGPKLAKNAVIKGVAHWFKRRLGV